MRPSVLSVFVRVRSVSVHADLCVCLCLYVCVCGVYICMHVPTHPLRLAAGWTWGAAWSRGSLVSVRLLPAAAPNVAHCLPVVHKHSPDISSSFYCCNNLSSGRRAGAVISSKADAVGVEWMGCQRGRHPSPWRPNVSPLRFSIWQGSSSHEVIPELSSPVLNYSIK